MPYVGAIALMRVRLPLPARQPDFHEAVPQRFEAH